MNASRFAVAIVLAESLPIVASGSYNRSYYFAWIKANIPIRKTVLQANIWIFQGK
jgi:hypothetical protein